MSLCTTMSLIVCGGSPPKGIQVILREKRIDDAEDDYAWRVDEELAKLDATRPLTMSFEDFKKYSREEIGFPSPRSRRFGVDTYEGLHIGNCMYYDIDLRNGETELGIMIGNRDYWSKGYGRDAVNTLIDHIFTSTTMIRIYLHTLDWNHRARRSFAKSGFRELRKVRRSGLDFVQMEIMRPEWEHMRQEEQQQLLATQAERDAEDTGTTDSPAE
jgi:RimJ/RimL family protein N-acetyltransferase